MLHLYWLKLVYHLKRIAINVLCRIGGRSLLLKNKPGKRILLYHGIDIKGRLDLNGRYLSADRFEQQIKYFKQHFNIITLNDFFNGNTDPDQFNIAIVFDDGYQNNVDLALPILEKYKVPATFFLSAIKLTEYSILWPDYLDLASFYSSQAVFIDDEMFFKKRGQYVNKQGQSLKAICKQKNWIYKQKIYTAFKEVESFIQNDESLKIYWQQLDDNAIRQLDASSYAEVGVHTYVHDNLGHLPITEAVDNLHKVKKYLENIVQHPINILAYADGSYSRELLDKAKEMGFKQQYAVDYLFKEDEEDERIFDRLTINPFTSLDHQINAILRGKY